jgi:predicted RND superfamily exporter protein
MMKLNSNFSTFLLVATVTLFFGFYNFKVEERGVNEEVLTDKENPLLKEILGVKQETRFTIPVTFTLAVQEGWEVRQIQFLKEARAALGGTWMSLVDVPGLRIEPDPNNPEADVVSEFPCLTRGKFPLDKWLQQTGGRLSPQEFHALEKDEFCGQFLSTMGQEKETTLSLMFYFPPSGQAELVTAWNVANFLRKGHPFPFWRFWRVDIDSHWEGVTVVGWVMARFLIHLGILFSALAIFLVSSAFIFRLFQANFSSRREALVATAHIWIGFIWQRGAMGWFGIPESPFTLFAYAGLFIAGPSFLLRVHEEGRAANALVGIVGMTAILGFANLLPFHLFGIPFGFRLTHIVELAESAILGIVCMQIVAVVIFPRLVQGVRREKIQTTPSRFDRLYERFLAWNLRWMEKRAFGLTRGNNPYYVLLGVAGIFGWSLWLLATERISTDTDSRQFILGSKMAEMLYLFNTPGGPGQENGHYYVKCQQEFSGCLPEVSRWIDAVVKDVPHIVADYSIMPALERLNREMWGERFVTPLQFGMIWEAFQIRMSIHQPQLWSPDYPNPPQGIHVTFGIATNTHEELKKVFAHIRAISADFPSLDVRIFNEDVLLVEADSYITHGMVSNLFSSCLTVGVIVYGFLVIKRRHGHYGFLHPVLGSIAAITPFLFSLSVFLLVGIKAAGNTLDMAAAPIAALLLNAGLDFSFYFLRTLGKTLQSTVSREQALRETFRAEGPLILKDGLLNAAGFLLLNFALFKPVRDLGMGLVFITVLAQIGTLIVMVPVLMLAIRGVPVSGIENSLSYDVIESATATGGKEKGVSHA